MPSFLLLLLGYHFNPLLRRAKRQWAERYLAEYKLGLATKVSTDGNADPFVDQKYTSTCFGNERIIRS
jgi:hypothetical protein